MRLRTILASIILILTCGLMLSAWASAAVVGRITQVEGRVDLLKGGKLPATPAKPQDQVESGDVLRTKSLSKAQITFMDNSVITLSPGSRMAVDDYQFQPAQKKRNAVLNLFQGMAHVVVNKLFKAAEPDFVVKTITAVIGVRGTDFGIRLQPNASTILNFKGRTQVANIFPEVGNLNRKAFKAAFAFGPPGSHNSVLLKDMQGTMVRAGLPPTIPFTITAEDKKQFMNQLSSGLVSQKKEQGSEGGGSRADSGTGGGVTGSGAGVTGGGTEFMTNLGGPDSGLPAPASFTGTTPSSVPVVVDTGLTTGGGTTAITTLNTITVPPVDSSTQTASLASSPPPPPSPPPVIPPPDTGTGGGGGTPTAGTYAFTQVMQTTWDSASTTGTTTSVTSTGWGLRTGVATDTAQALPDSYTGYFTSSGSGDRTLVQGSQYSTTSASTGVTTATLTGTVTGVVGGTLTGTATLTGTSSFGQTLSFTGTVTIDPSGVLTFTYGGANGTATNTSQTRLASATGSTTYTPGAYFTQSLTGAMSNTSSSPYNIQTAATVWGGTATTGGSLASYYAVSVTGTTSPTWNFNYLPQVYDALEGTIQGVVSGQQGAATITPNYPDRPFASFLATPPSPYLFGVEGGNILPIVTTVNIDPNTGVLTGTAHYTDFLDGKYASQVYTMTQTPQATPVTPITGNYTFTETYNGAFWINGNSGNNGAAPGSTMGFGWGNRTGTGSLASYLNGYFASFDNGNWTAASGSLPSSWYGSALVSGNGVSLGTTLLSGSVSGTLGQTLTGSMTWVGSLLNGASFNYQGTVSLDSDGHLQFVYGNGNGSATWIYPGGATGTASGTMSQYPGYYFTQTMPGTYQLNTNSTNGTLTVSGTTSTRALVYGGNLGPFSGNFSLYSPSGSLPNGSSSGTLSPDMYMEGVVGTSWLGANFGAASLTMNSSLTGAVTIPGNVSLSPGGTYFTVPGVFVPSNVGPLQVYASTGGSSLPTALTQLPLYSFSETYQGFRISAGTTPFTLASVEGYGWGTITGTAGTGTVALPTSYTGGATTGYFVSQDLGTRAAMSAMTSGWAGVTGSFTGTLSGAAGQTLTGQMVFTGTNSLGATLNYQGNATLASNGTLVWNYNGTWTAGTNTGTASGTWTQVLGTYFSEAVNNGTFVQAAVTTTSGGTTVSIGTLKDAAPFAGTRTVAGSTTNVTGSAAGSLASTVNTFPAGPNTGSGSMAVQGVVAGSSWETRWGVATLNGTGATATPGISGPVTLDPSGKLTGQFVDTLPNGPGQPADSMTINYVSVPTGSGQTTSSFVQTVSGTVAQTPIGATPSTQGTLTSITPLAGTGTGTIPGNINANINLTSTAISPSFVTAGTPTTMTGVITGAVAGPAGGPQTGAASMHSVKTTGANTRVLHHLGTATFKPAAGSTPPTLTTNLNGINPTRTGVFASQTGTVTVTPKP